MRSYLRSIRDQLRVPEQRGACVELFAVVVVDGSGTGPARWSPPRGLGQVLTQRGCKSQQEAVLKATAVRSPLRRR